MVIWGLEYFRLLALGFGWLAALQWRPPTIPTQFSRSAFGFGNLVPFESSLRWGALFWICGPRLLNVATGGVWDLFVLLPKILGCRFFFARAFLLGRLEKKNLFRISTFWVDSRTFFFGRKRGAPSD